MAKNNLKNELYQLAKSDITIFDIILNNSFEGYWFWNIKSPENILICPKLWSTLGYNPDKMNSKPDVWKYTIYSNSLKEIESTLERFNKDHEETYDQIIRFEHKNGNSIWLQSQGFTFPDKTENTYYKLITFNNITTHKKNEDKLHQLEELIDNMIEGYQTLDHDLKYLSLNKAAEKHAQRPKEELLGKKYEDCWPGSNDTKVYSLIKDCLEKHNSYYFENEFIYPNGEIKWFYLGIRPFEDGVFILSYDITDLKNTEQKLVEAKDKAEESDRLKSAFLTNMSHEIRTPMNAIIGFSSFLKDVNISREDSIKYVNIIINSSNHLLNLINDIIDISKIEAGQTKVIKSNFNLNRLLKDLYSFFHSQLVAKKKYSINLKLDIPVHELYILTDETRLRQILINLIGNAVKFTESGEIEYGYRIIDNQIEFYVRDTGIGIPKEKCELIFERFQQGTTSTEKLYGGTGLGLTIAKACTYLLNGKIWLESIPDFGTTFYFTIEYTKGEQPVKTKNKNDIVYQFNNELILIAEDDDYNFDYFDTILSKHKLRFIRTKSGRETIKKALAHNDLKLILMDIQMPDLTGVDATLEIRKHKPDLPIIAQTAYAMNSDKEKYLQIGCNAYISKPIEEKHLLQLIDEFLG